MKTLLFSLLVAVLLLGMSPILMAKDTLVVSQNTEAKTLHPLAMYSVIEQNIATNIYDSLISRDSDGKLIPGLATSWELIDETTWRFYLRKGVKWQDGGDFTADDVIFTFEDIGRTPINRYKFIMQKIKKVSKVDDFTVDIETNGPYAILADAFYHTIFIMSKAYCEGKTNEFLAEHPMGTGPYTLKNWVRGSHMDLEAFEGCWRGTPSIKKVQFKPISNDATRLAGLISGGIDLTTDVPVQYVEMVKNAPGIDVIKKDGMRIIFFQIKQDDPDLPTANKKVREALLLGINEQEIVDKLLLGYSQVASQLPAPFMRGFNDELQRPSYNPERAKELLAEAGFANGLDLTINVPNDRFVMDNEIGVAISQQLSKVGIRVKLEAQPWSIHSKGQREGKYIISMAGWGEATFDTARILKTHIEHAGVKDQDFDRKLNEADEMTDIEAREKALAALNQYVLENVYVLPLHWQSDIYGVSQEIKGFVPHVKQIIDLPALSFN